MANMLKAEDHLDREFLEIRRRLVDIAAALDRIDGADGADQLDSDPRIAKLHQAVHLLTDGQPDRAERVQMMFSDKYDATWQKS